MSTTLLKVVAATVAVLALLAALFYAEQYIEGLGYKRRAAEDQAAIEKVKREAGEQLAAEQIKVQTYERALQLKTTAQNLKDAEHEKVVADRADLIRRAAGPAGRLRDPNAKPAPGCGRGSGGPEGQAAGSADSGPENGAETGGLLSVPLTDLLAKALRESDAINVAYASCRADAYTVRAPE